MRSGAPVFVAVAVAAVLMVPGRASWAEPAGGWRDGAPRRRPPGTTPVTAADSRRRGWSAIAPELGIERLVHLGLEYEWLPARSRFSPEVASGFGPYSRSGTFEHWTLHVAVGVRFWLGPCPAEEARSGAFLRARTSLLAAFFREGISEKPIGSLAELQLSLAVGYRLRFLRYLFVAADIGGGAWGQIGPADRLLATGVRPNLLRRRDPTQSSGLMAVVDLALGATF